MTNKYNPIRVCSCFNCRHSRNRSPIYTEANRKFRRLSSQQLRDLVSDVELDKEDLDEVDDILIDGGYSS